MKSTIPRDDLALLKAARDNDEGNLVEFERWAFQSLRLPPEKGDHPEKFITEACGIIRGFGGAKFNVFMAGLKMAVVREEKLLQTAPLDVVFWQNILCVAEAFPSLPLVGPVSRLITAYVKVYPTSEDVTEHRALMRRGAGWLADYIMRQGHADDLGEVNSSEFWTNVIGRRSGAWRSDSQIDATICPPIQVSAFKALLNINTHLAFRLLEGTDDVVENYEAYGVALRQFLTRFNDSAELAIFVDKYRPEGFFRESWDYKRHNLQTTVKHSIRTRMVVLLQADITNGKFSTDSEILKSAQRKLQWDKEAIARHEEHLKDMRKAKVLDKLQDFKLWAKARWEQDFTMLVFIQWLCTSLAVLKYGDGLAHLWHVISLTVFTPLLCQAFYLRARGPEIAKEYPYGTRTYWITRGALALTLCVMCPILTAYTKHSFTAINVGLILSMMAARFEESFPAMRTGFFKVRAKIRSKFTKPSITDAPSTPSQPN